MNRCRRRFVASAVALPLGLSMRPARGATPVDEPIDPSLREAVHRLSIAGTGAGIVVTSYRPAEAGPFPWIMLSHGTSPGAEANRTLGRYRRPALVREWTRRGYAVIVPVRRGYGASGGARLGDSYGTCAAPDFRRAGEEAAKDLLAVHAWTRSQADLDRTRWMLVGQSAGGFASIYTASKRPEGLAAVLAFAPGRGGDPVARRYEPCGSDRLADLFAAIAPRIEVPVLWFYAQNDQYIGTRVQRLWFERFRGAGGRGELTVVGAFKGHLGHGVFPAPEAVPIWTGAVKRFMQEYGVKMPF